jgi:hypothetical protein
MTHTIRNLGPASAGAFVIRFYLSADDELEGGDVLLGTAASDRIIAVADAAGQHAEFDETNDVAVSSSLIVAR